MRRIFKKNSFLTLLVAALMLSCFSACGSDKSSSKMQSTNNVEDTINQQIAKEETSEASTETPKETLVVPPTESSTEQTTQSTTEVAKESTEAETTSVNETSTDEDIDLTVMDSNMVYSTVYQMMADAPSYVGKKVKMKGTYYSSYDEVTAKRYYFVIIKDATACCQQGLEFIWDDGNHVYPDEYPAEETEVEVEGVFETYKDNPEDTFEYIHLVDASLKILDDENQE